MADSKKKSSPEELLRAHVDQLAAAIGVDLVDPVAQAYEAEQVAKAAEAEAKAEEKAAAKDEKD